MEVVYGEITCKTLYHPNGDPSTIIPYSNRKIHGTVKKYLVNGVPQQFEEWIDGHQQGITTIFQDGVPYSTISYLEGKKNGIQKIYRSDGTIASEISWKNDLKDGPSSNFIEGVERCEWYYKGKKVSRSDYERQLTQ